ncbi:MAG: nitroreductase family protein [Lachnospiraceae bacterium]|nr:nitroreductase family protein [Lachnospiraceae bacterium]
MSIYEERKSIRKYKPDMIPDETLREILEAGRLAPSAKNRQPWKFLVAVGEKKEEICALMEKGIMKQKKSRMMPEKFKKGLASAENTLRIMREAPVLVLVLNTHAGDPYKPVMFGKRVSEIHDSLSIGAAVENMCLRAQELEIGSLWIGNTVFAHSEITEYLGTKDQLSCAVSLGYADEKPAGRPRKTFEEVVEFL